MEILATVLVSICGGVGLFIGIWLFVTGLLRVMAGMTKKLDVEVGQFLRESSWGSGSVNGVNARNCLRVAEYESGWIVRVTWLLGDGKLWLPKSGVKIGQSEKVGFLSPKSRMITCGDDHVRLFGSLADFVEQSFPTEAT